MPQYPLPVVGCFIFNQKEEVLLARSPKWGKGKVWCVPGGKIDYEETIGEAAVRETEEEVGLKTEFVKMFAVYNAIFPKYFYKKKHFIFFECRLLVMGDQGAKPDGREITKFEWMPLRKALSQKNLEPFTKKALQVLKAK